jgi:putative sigma-54 modulation protein
MKLHVHWKGLRTSAPAREHLERRLAFALGRFARRVRHVRALLSDENGLRGGADKQCRLQARTRVGLVQVEGCSADLHAAIDIAAERMQRTLARLLDREHFQNTGRWRAEGLVRRRHASLPA